MGTSNAILYPFYTSVIKPVAPVALLGFQDETLFPGKCYDLALGNWDINSDWELDRKYNTIISLRCPYFAKDPLKFIEQVRDHLEPNGTAYLDWGLGDHWRFDDFKVGWKKGEDQEYAYSDTNYLWSSVWRDDFPSVPSVEYFSDAIRKYGYDDLASAVKEEIPSLFMLDNEYFDKHWAAAKTYFKFVPIPKPQLYILLELTK